MNKSKLKLVGDIVAPSGLSLAIVSTVSALLLLAGAANVLGTTTSFYRLLLGDYASGGLVESTRQDFLTVFTFFENTTLNNILLFVFWGIIGLAVWFVVSNTTTLFGELGEDLQEIRDEDGIPHPDHSALRDTVLRGLYHVAVVMIIMIYVFFLWSVFFRWLIDVFISGFGVQITPSGAFTMFSAWLVACLACHVLVVLLRLLFLRQRLLGD
ncbi:hypothetical protein HY003_03105 [Candidatus Saccharibacteria bacterium]|nr:hypothetical protein [Candidatus Saccharibacteria bacterium]MBI3338263.1 hypothetical protein [Candidatus Saccharibacteria bacterium]